MSRIHFILALFLASLLSRLTWADSPIQSNGNGLSINISGGDGNWGKDGSDAGSINLFLAYADSAKKTVKISGNTIFNNRTTTFSQVASLSDLNGIYLYAVGGDGGAGYSGNNGVNGQPGQNGSDGWNGNNGCPPTDGRNGGDGTNGTNGTNGTDGHAGGSGGNGGNIHINVPANQNELLLLVTASTNGGKAGSGGSGGSGGYGGAGGTGGRGGSGGTNTCPPDNDNGNSNERNRTGDHTHDRDNNNGDNHVALIDRSNGRDGSRGRDGYSGSNGSSGSDGANGYSGSNGQLMYTTTTTGQESTDYPNPFNIELSNIKTIDDNEDGILEPSEDFHITEITVTNTGSMPTPIGQSFNIILKNSAALNIKSIHPIILKGVLAPNASKVFTFKKGELVFTAVDDDTSIGKEITLNTNIAINSINYDAYVDLEQAIAWPVVFNRENDNISGYFGDALYAKYNLQNVSSKELGPKGEQPIEVEFSWISDTIPGSDVTAVLADGRSFPLNKPFLISDFTIPAHGEMSLPVKLLVKNSKSQIATDGSLQITVRLKDFISGIEDAVTTYLTPVHLVLDIRPQAFDNTIDLKYAKIHCIFSDKLIKKMKISKLEISKSANSDQVNFKVFREMLFIEKNSEDTPSPAFDFASYYGIFSEKQPDVNTILKLLNSQVAEASKNANKKSWIMSPDSCFVNK